MCTSGKTTQTAVLSFVLQEFKSCIDYKSSLVLELLSWKQGSQKMQGVERAHSQPGVSGHQHSPGLCLPMTPFMVH